MTIARLLCGLCLLSVASAWFSPHGKWNDLAVTYDFIPFNSVDGFDSLPRTESEAKKQGWTSINSRCDEDSKFLGRRYVKNKDYAVYLLYDVNGYIAGIQTGIPKFGLDQNYPPQSQRNGFFLDDGQHFVATAYFTDPRTICKGGRTAEQFEKEGTGSGLYLQYGPDAVNLVEHIPRKEADLKKTHKSWGNGRCFPTMGVHYWYDIKEDMDCKDFVPFFLLYNGGQLTAFGFALGDSYDSKRYEHPPKLGYWLFFDPVPKCLNTYAEVSTLHIFLTSTPLLNWC